MIQNQLPVAKYGSNIPMQKELNTLLAEEENLKNYLDSTKKPNMLPSASTSSLGSSSFVGGKRKSRKEKKEKKDKTSKKSGGKKERRTRRRR